MNVEIRRNGQLEHLIYARPPMIEGLLIDSSTQSTGQSAFMGLEAKQAGRSDNFFVQRFPNAHDSEQCSGRRGAHDPSASSETRLMHPS